MQIAIRYPLVTFLLAVVAVLLNTPDALAFADDATVGTLTCSGGIATGQLFVSSPSCPTTLSKEHFFSFLICNFEQLSGNILGHMFCGMISNLIPAVWAMVTLATVIYGVLFTIGVIPARGPEAIKFLLKLAFIAGFATNADLLIGFGYRFFLAAMSDGATIALKVLNTSGINSAGDVYAELDKLLSNLFTFVTGQQNAKDNEHYCDNAIFAVVALMLAVFPMIAYLAILLVARVLMSLFRAVFAYIFAIVGIAFLLTLSPFFLTFYLFKLTTNLFDRWLGYLVSFSMQVVLLFSFLAFVILIEKAVIANNIIKNVGNITKRKQEAPEVTAARFTWTYCTICDFKIIDPVACPAKDHTCPDMPTNHKDKDGKGDYMTSGMMVCKDNPPVLISPTKAMSPEATNQAKSLLTLLTYGLLPLLVLAMIVEQLLQLIPSLAQKLASGLNANYAPQIGGGLNFGGASTRMPGESILQDFGSGFHDGYWDPKNKNTISKGLDGVREGFSAMVTGRRSSGATLSDSPRDESRGVVNSFQRWTADPNRFGL